MTTNWYTIIPPTVAALCTLVISLLNRRAAKQHKKDILEVHLMINSRMDAWVKVIAERSYALGFEEGTLQKRMLEVESEILEKVKDDTKIDLPS